jgi:cold-inducible RNA-binding protein
MEAPKPAGRPADDGEGRKVFVGGIPFGVEKRDIQEDFSKFGPIEDVYLPMDRETRKPRGFGFVTFVDARDANEAVSAMHGCAHRFSHRGPSARATCYSH